MTNAYKIVSVLLSYPTAELAAAGDALRMALDADALSGPREKAALAALIDDLAGRDLYEAEERYVLLFDRTRSLSLHLFEHVHGESRDRGQAMVDLVQTYGAQGFDISARELPDHLPLFLEYLSTRPPAEAGALLGQALHIVSALRERLERRGSVYANAFVALEGLADAEADRGAAADIAALPEDDPDDLAALDVVWAEEAVRFGGGAGEAACGPDRLRTRLRAAKRASPPTTLKGGF